jgi:CHAT domain-containing protein
MQPIRALLGDSRQLLVSPDGDLNLIPFEALVDEHNKYLVESYSLSYLTSGRDLLRMNAARGIGGAPLLVANPEFGAPEANADTGPNGARSRKTSDGSRRSVTILRNLSDAYFAPLSGTAAEARAIQSLFPDAKLLTGTDANETALKQVAAPSILHIATHGFFIEDQTGNDIGTAVAKRTGEINSPVDNPLLRSGIALAGANLRNTGSDDGILTALEASGLNLWGTKLVVLSACDTGLGEVRVGEGVYGLRRAFAQAGAESLVMSLWPVSDLVTRELMTNYYKNLKQGTGRGDSLRQVQLEMLKRPTRQHPFYWASFIQSGDWRSIKQVG